MFESKTEKMIRSIPPTHSIYLTPPIQLGQLNRLTLSQHTQQETQILSTINGNKVAESTANMTETMRSQPEIDYQLEQTYPWDNFDYIPLEFRRPTTMVIIPYLNGPIDIDALFEILPVDVPSGIDPNDISNTMKDGSIISARYSKDGIDIKRGVQIGKFWPLAIMFNIYYKGTRYSFRLTWKKIHIAGVTSEEMALRISELIIERIKQVRRALVCLQENPQAKILLEHFYKLIQDPEIKSFSEYLEKLQIICRGSLDIVDQNDPEIINLLNIAYLYLYELKFYPLHERIIAWNERISKLIDLINSNKTPQTLSYSLSSDSSEVSETPEKQLIDKIIPLDLDVLYLYKGNINYAFTLGFNLNPMKFIELIKQINGFTVVYEPAICPAIRVTISYEFPEALRDYIDKRDNRTNIGFQIQTHGHVVFTGPNQALMTQAYNILMTAIYQNRAEIEGPPPSLPIYQGKSSKSEKSAKSEKSKGPEQILDRQTAEEVYRRYYSFHRHQLSNFIVDPKEIRCSCSDGHLPKCLPRFPAIGSEGKYLEHGQKSLTVQMSN